MRVVSYQEVLNDPGLVAKVNKAFHDVDVSTYELKHPEIYVAEKKGWESIAANNIEEVRKNRGNITVMDVGTGAGFVVDCLDKVLREGDEVFFADISENMLEFCRKKFSDKIYKKKFVVTDTLSFALPDSCVDVITVNSVLHHLPDYSLFIDETIRLLRPGGLLIIKHEPNKRFANRLILNRIYHFLSSIRGARSFLKKFRKSKNANHFHEKIFNLLKERERIDMSNLSSSELQAIVDVQSPTASGGLDKERGFDPFEIVDDYNRYFLQEKISTYGYFAKIDDSMNTLRRVISSVLRKIYPKDGYFFDLILKKYE